jgi:hypothetical protein
MTGRWTNFKEDFNIILNKTMEHMAPKLRWSGQYSLEEGGTDSMA